MSVTEQPPSGNAHKKIRSFVMRTGRLTAGQALALKTGWSQFGLHLTDGFVDFEQLFNRQAPVILEIGFGNGDSLLQMAQAAPEKNFIGIEVHTPGVGHLLGRMLAEGTDNIRLYQEDAVDVLDHCIPDGSLDAVQLFFPDPWHKRRHHKRRLVQPDFIEQISRKLKSGGYFHMATDWQSYAKHMLQLMEASANFCNTAGAGQYQPSRPAERPETKFEQRGQRLGHGSWDLIFKKTSE